jgi:hypothetical protein
MGRPSGMASHFILKKPIITWTNFKSYSGYITLDFPLAGSTAPNFADEAAEKAPECIFSFTSGGNLFIILGKLASGDRAARPGKG